MSGTTTDDIKEQEPEDDIPKNQVGDENLENDPKGSEKNDENLMPSAQQEEEVVKKKYGGILPKKPPLISKDHERAYFDSADWALGKQGAQKPKGPLEALLPKLQPTHQQVRSRRSAYAPADDGEVNGVDNSSSTSEEQGCTVGGGENNSTGAEDQHCHE